MRELPVRKRIRLDEYDYSNAGAYFVTICTKDKHEFLGEIVGDVPLRVPQCILSHHGLAVDAQIQSISRVYPDVLIDNYVIMPNHIHMIVTMESGTRRGTSPTKVTIPQIVQSLKSMITKRFGFSIWQRSYHDHIIRNEEEYKRISQYIDENPLRWTEDCYYTK
ncbi:MAG: transposase [Oscillospiraceae bacterium]|nr:transposase [Oscillospiraceae bacterium]